MTSSKSNRAFFIIGSGFSKAIGLPIASEINAYFSRDNRKKILKYGSSEMRWLDFANQVDEHNGKIGHDWIRYGYVLNQLVTLYVESNELKFINYEDFIQYVEDNINSREFIIALRKKSESAFFQDYPSHISDPKYKDHVFYNLMSQGVRQLLYELVADILYPRKLTIDYQSAYSSFIQTCSELDQFDIVSLNHDLVLEHLQLELGLPKLNDGFSVTNSNLLNDYNQPIRVYQKAFETGNRFIKLHGSIDLYKLEHLDESNGRLIHSGEFTYYKTTNYHEKHSPHRINPQTGVEVQSVHFNITPQFVTGTQKELIFDRDEMHRSLYLNFQDISMQHSTLVIIGYSYRDEHVNKVLTDAIDKGSIRRIVNINPSLTFQLNQRNATVLNLHDLSEFNTSQIEGTN